MQFQRSAAAASRSPAAAAASRSPAAIYAELGGLANLPPSVNPWYHLWKHASGFTVTIKFVQPLGAHSQHLGTTITVNLEASDTIGKLKDMIANVTHIPKEELRLTHICPRHRHTHSNMRNDHAWPRYGKRKGDRVLRTLAS